MAAACDPASFKVYMVETHSLRPNVIALATSLGVVVLDLIPDQVG